MVHRTQAMSGGGQGGPEQNLESPRATLAVRVLLQTAAELRAELSGTAVEHTKFLADHARRAADILHAVKAAGFASDADRLQVISDPLSLV